MQIEGKNILVFYSSVNTKGKKDATGAFVPEGKKFCAVNRVPAENRIAVDCVGQTPKKRFEQVCMELRNRCNIQWIAMFCHGWSSGLQFGINKKNVGIFTEYMRYSCVDNVILTLYACSTASENKAGSKPKMPATNNGFADTLRDTMLAKNFRGGWIDAHLTAGHTTVNPYVMRFAIEPGPNLEIDLPGGFWLVQPQSPQWKEWIMMLKTNEDNMRYTFSLWFEQPFRV